MKDSAGDNPTLAEKLEDDWQIFEDSETAGKFLAACCSPWDPKDNPDQDTFDPERLVGEEELFFLGQYGETQRLSGLWNELKTEISNSNRFFAGRAIVDDLGRALAPTVTLIKTNTICYRARLSDGNSEYPRKQMGAPPATQATAGRANPSGIPYLYVASTAEVAVSELRPHVGDCLSVGTFKLKCSQKIIDLRDPRVGSPFRWGTRLGHVVGIMPFLRDLGDELSRPVGLQKTGREYLPTQYLCEFLKISGYDGVAYNSGLGDGNNLALFNPAAAKCTGVATVTITNVKIAFSPVAI